MTIILLTEKRKHAFNIFIVCVGPKFSYMFSFSRFVFVINFHPIPPSSASEAFSSKNGSFRSAHGYKIKKYNHFIFAYLIQYDNIIHHYYSSGTT